MLVGDGDVQVPVRRRLPRWPWALALGVLALMAFLLGKIQLRAESPKSMSVLPGIEAGSGLRCRNEKCITNGEGVRYLTRDFRLRESDAAPMLACAYCGRENEARFIGHATDDRKACKP